MNNPDLINSASRALKADKLAECEALCRQILAQSPDDASALHLFGLVCHRQGQGDRAVALIKKAVEQSPDRLQFIVNLGVVLLGNRQLNAALDQFQRATRLDPGSVAAFNNLGYTLKELGHLEQAEQAIRKALALAPGNSDVLDNLGLCLQLQGQLREAAGYMQTGINNSGTALQLHNYGIVMKTLERLEEAKAAQQKALQLDPACTPAWLYLVLLNHYNTPGHPDLQAIKQLLGRPELAEESREHLHFALGKALDDCGEFDAAFEHFQAGNRSMNRRQPYDRDRFSRQATDTIAAFTPEFIHRHRLDLVAQPALVFIVGLPRSGKTRLERQLCKHPDIYQGGELFALPALSVRLLTKHRCGYPPAPGCAIDSEALQKAARHYRKFTHKLAPDSRYITDTLPANAKHLGLVATLFPDARIIHCARDPEDALISIYCKHFSTSNRYSCRLDNIRWYMHQHNRLMQHWRTALPNPILDVRYEDLVTDTAGTLQRVADFCALPVTAALLEGWNNAGMDRRFIGHARHYKRYLEEAAGRPG